MLWMERFTVLIYFALNIFLFGFDFLISGSMSEWPTFIEVKQIFILCLILSLIVWFMFRSIDYICGGPMRRKIKRSGFPIRQF